MKKSLLRLVPALLAAIAMASTLSGCSIAPTHPSLAVKNALPPLVPARHYVADWDGNGGYQISPDGQQLMWAARKGLNQGLFVKNLASGTVRSYGIASLGRWAQDSRHILLDLHNGDENSSVFLLDSFQDKADLRELTPFKGARSTVHSTIDASDDLLISSNKRDAKVFDLYRYHAADGAMELIAQNPGTVELWLTDRQGVLLGRASKDGDDWSYEAKRQTGTDTRWEKIFKVSMDDTVWPVEVNAAEQTVWALSNRGRDKIALVQIDLRNGQETVFYEDARGDIDRVFISQVSGKPLAVTLQPGMQAWKFFDSRWEQLASQLLKPETRQLDLLSASRDETILTAVVQDDQGGHSLLVNRDTQESTELGALGSSRIHAMGSLPQRTAIAFTSRDGLPITAYLTIPTDMQGNAIKNLPTVLLVHGGPWARDTWSSYNLAYFLANRGYAVLQVNYRGSTGFGKRFELAAKGEFAGKMHTDLLDGLEYLKERGIADVGKVAIMGGSYGGYASLVGMTHTPGTFACGISLFGISDLPSLVNDFPAYWELGKGKWYAYVGDPSNSADVQRMREQSPLYRAAEVKGPVLILQGARDARVHLDQSTRMVEALRSAGKPVEYVMFPNAGHGLTRWPDNLTFYRKTEDFLAQCLGGRSAGYDFFELVKLAL